MEKFTFCRGKGFHVGYSSKSSKYADREQAILNSLHEYELTNLTPAEIEIMKAKSKRIETIMRNMPISNKLVESARSKILKILEE